ncbi:hypothetical protein WA026_001775 [Henosepilachna vigintioctopunctata]|uniref:PUM-HD domain-containing protein n=1 Tax=Henosepilachna vigintioctopunctata TaxID=420089 RepID=A0AAW1UM58_9CUCU
MAEKRERSEDTGGGIPLKKQKKSKLKSMSNMQKVAIKENKKSKTEQNATKNENNKLKSGPKFTKNENNKLKPEQKVTRKENKKFNTDQKPEDWNLFKKQKKELRLKRKQGKSNFQVVVEAKRLGELLRRKELKDGISERNRLVNELHTMLKTDGNYTKFVMAHDTSRIVQWLLKYSSSFVRQEILKELLGSISIMMQSKYGVFCIKRLLKYGTVETRSKIIKAFYGNSVKLASHAMSAPYLEYAYSTWATPQEKLHLVQEFYGDMYKHSKDDNIKCLKDVFEMSPDMKTAALSATKANLSRILNKNLLDSGLVQTVLYQFLLECGEEDRAEMISQLVSHIVVISNSKDGSRAAMNCIWFGTNKDRKVLMKAMKEHLVELCKHEHGHCTVISLLDAVDDTVLLNKVIISAIFENAKDLATNEWGRKVLLWLVVPDDSSYFHPKFIKELKTGRERSNSKKPVEMRRTEILSYSSKPLLNLIISEPTFWLSDSILAYEMLAIIKSATIKEVGPAFDSIVEVITDINWRIKKEEEEFLGIEHAGLHLVLKKIAQHDKINTTLDLPTFGVSLVKKLSNDTIESWIKFNRGCFLLLAVFENNAENVQKQLSEKLGLFKTQIKGLSSPGAKILLKKLKS